jgi:hypothetical protein
MMLQTHRIVLDRKAAGASCDVLRLCDVTQSEIVLDATDPVLPDPCQLRGELQMTKTATKSVMPDTAAETTFLASAGQQMALDALRIEIGAIKAMLPGLTASQANALASDADRRRHDAALEAMFDNMPV